MGIFKMTEDGLDYKDADDLYEEQQEYSQYHKEEADYYAKEQEQYYDDLVKKNSMTKLEPEQKDILEKLNQLALEENWGTVDRDPNGIPKGVAVVMEAMEEIKRLREQPKEILQEYSKMLIDSFVESGNNECNTVVSRVLKKDCPQRIKIIKRQYAQKYGVEIENE